MRREIQRFKSVQHPIKYQAHILPLLEKVYIERTRFSEIITVGMMRQSIIVSLQYQTKPDLSTGVCFRNGEYLQYQANLGLMAIVQTALLLFFLLLRR